MFVVPQLGQFHVVTPNQLVRALIYSTELDYIDGKGASELDIGEDASHFMSTHTFQPLVLTRKVVQEGLVGIYQSLSFVQGTDVVQSVVVSPGYAV